MKYEKEFKVMISDLYLSGRKTQELSKEYNLNANMILRWVQEHKQSTGSFPGKGNAILTDQEKELVQLRKQLADVQMERDILKKAVGIFSKSDK